MVNAYPTGVAVHVMPAIRKLYGFLYDLEGNQLLMKSMTKIGLLTILAMLLWVPAAAASPDDSGSVSGGDLVAQTDTDDDDDDMDDENGTDNEDEDGDEPGVPETGAGGAAAAGGTGIMLIGGIIAFLSATAAGALAFLRRS